MMNKIILFSFVLAITFGFQVRVISPDIPTSPQQFKDKTSLKLSINSADRFIYPDNKNTFQMYLALIIIFLSPPLIASRNMIEIVSNVYLYPILIIDQAKGSISRKLNLMHPVTRQIIKPVQQPIMISPLQKIQYFDAEGGFSIKSVLFSGYGMMILFGGFLYFCYQNVMPKLEEAQEAPSN